MAVRIPWDKYETAILIEACEKYNDGLVSEKEAIKVVSNELRTRAQKKGINIDGIFRNENGISMQFKIINGLILKKNSGLKNASKLFVDMVELYKNDNCEFKKILKKAREVDIQSKTIQEKFSAWLSSFLSPAQMSEIYITYYDLDNCLQAEGLLKTSLFEITELDVVKKLLNELITNKSFRSAHRMQISKYCRVIDFYYKWLLQNEYLQYKAEINGIETNEGSILGVPEDQTKNRKQISTIEIVPDELTESVEKENTKKEFLTWLGSRGMKHSDIMVICIDMSRMSKMVINADFTDKELYDVESLVALKLIISKFLSSNDFVNLDQRLQRQYKESLEYYLEFIESKADKMQEVLEEQGEVGIGFEDRDVYAISKKEESIVASSIDNEIQKRVIELLTDEFEDGYKLKSIIFENRFKVAWSDRFGEEFPLSDEQFKNELMTVGTVRDDKVFVKKDSNKDLLQNILKEMMQVFDAGGTCVYIEAIYDRYYMEFVDELQIYDKEVLSEILIDMSCGKLCRKWGFFCLPTRQPEPKRDVEDVLRQSHVPMTYDDLARVLWYIPLDKVKYIMATTKSIVQVASETYFYAENLPISAEEIAEITRLIHAELYNKSYIADAELQEIININLPSTAINTAEYSTYGLRNCLGYILKEKFSFNGQVISELDKEVSMAEVYANYCRERVHVTLDEIKQLATDMNTTIYWDAIREEMVRISKDNFVRDDQIEFAVNEIDELLETVCEDKYIPLKDVGLYMHFPTIGFPWNGYIMESYVHRYSRKFKLLHLSFSKSGFYGAIVRVDSGINDYKTLLVDILKSSNEWNNRNTALEYLVEQGYQQRKRYLDIEDVMKQARLLKEKMQ